MARERRREVRPDRDAEAGESGLNQWNVRVPRPDDDADFVPGPALAMVSEHAPGDLHDLVVLGDGPHQDLARRGTYWEKAPDGEASPPEMQQSAARRAGPRRQADGHVAALTLRRDQVEFGRTEAREAVPVERVQGRQGAVTQSSGRAVQPLVTSHQTSGAKLLLHLHPHAAQFAKQRLNAGRKAEETRPRVSVATGVDEFLERPRQLGEEAGHVASLLEGRRATRSERFAEGHLETCSGHQARVRGEFAGMARDRGDGVGAEREPVAGEAVAEMLGHSGRGHDDTEVVCKIPETPTDGVEHPGGFARSRGAKPDCASAHGLVPLQVRFKKTMPLWRTF